MGEHRFIMCHDCGVYADLDKLYFGTYFEKPEQQRQEKHADKLMQFLESHKQCALEWTGEYAGLQHGYPPETYSEERR